MEGECEGWDGEIAEKEGRKEGRWWSGVGVGEGKGRREKGRREGKERLK